MGFLLLHSSSQDSSLLSMPLCIKNNFSNNLQKKNKKINFYQSSDSFLNYYQSAFYRIFTTTQYTNRSQYASFPETHANPPKITK